MELDPLSLIITIGLPIGLFYLGWKLGKKQTKELNILMTKNFIDTLKHIGIVSEDSGIRVNEDGVVVKPVSATFTSKYNIEAPIRRTPI